MENRYVRVETVLFFGRKNISWNEVEKYMKKYQGKCYSVNESKETIKVNLTSIDEFVSSKYTRRLKGTLAKAKANIALTIPELIGNATNRRWIQNNDEKHRNNASKGWYRYDAFFSLPVKAENENEKRWNNYSCTIIVNANDTGMYLYDIINIKKESE